MLFVFIFTLRAKILGLINVRICVEHKGGIPGFYIVLLSILVWKTL